MKKIQLIIYSSLLWILLFIPTTVFAVSESIQSFDTEIIAHQDGSFDVKETIKYNFGENNKHGIFRDIPTVSQVDNLYRQSQINILNVSRDNADDAYTVSQNNNQISVKIGRSNQTISGEHIYIISYLVKNGIGSNYSDHDEIYWNVTGDKWQVPIFSASAVLTTDFGITPNQAICFTGVLGSKDKNCYVPANFPLSPITATAPLNPSQGLTVVAGFPVNTFPKSVLNQTPAIGYTSHGNLLWFWLLYLGVAGVLNFILAPALLFWYLKYKRKKRFGPVSVNFDIPKDEQGKRITPAEAGIIDNTKLDKNDVIATIFDLAIRKYIKIEQIKKERTLGIFGGGDDYIILKLKDYTELETFEKVLLKRLFKNGDEVEIASLSTDFYETFQTINTAVFKSLVDKMYYTKNPQKQQTLLALGGVFSFILLAPLLAIILFFLCRKLNGRTTKGDDIDFKIDGLKLFLKNMSREYKWQAKNLYTVEKYIPYAIALGYINEFMDQLKILYPNYQPNWYTGNMAFYAISSNMLSSMNAGLTNLAPSSSSGFSGGGSSGGGGGGGGGGSW